MFKVLQLSIVILFVFLKSVNAEILKSFKVVGNERISKETIINFSDLSIGSDLDSSSINNSLKKIYNSNFFENVSLKFDKGILVINVLEYPIIQEIKFTGIKGEKLKKNLYEAISLKEKNPFNKILLKKDLNKILNIFKQSGYYFANVNILEEMNSNNTVTLVYEIDRGEKALIKNIRFIGDKIFKDRKLHSVITSEENKFWKFISKGKYLDVERINLDKRLLKNFYLNNGYYQVKIEDAYSQIINEDGFSLTYQINAGKKFYFNNFEVLLPNDYDPNQFKKLNKVFNKLKDNTYDYSKISKILDEIDKISLLANYEFIDAEVSENIVDNNKINFVFQIKESEKFYVERINIFGNNITEEGFIRQQFIVDEGDPFNKLLHNKSMNKLRSRGIFASVKSEIEDGKDDALKIINVFIDEKPTGEISAGAGYGTNGSTFVIGIRENNFAGKGITVDSNISLSEESLKGKISYTNPNFRYSDRSLISSIESTTTDKEKDSGYKSSLNRVAIGTSFEQYENFFIRPYFSISNESVTTTANASENYKKQEGSYFDTIFDYSITYDRRNSSFQPSEGYVSKWVQGLPVYADGSPIINGYEITAYKKLMDDMVFSFGFYSRAINSLSDEDVRVSKRLYMPSSRLRGFEYGKVGPKDGNDFVGGNYLSSINVSSTVPYLLETNENADIKVFFDAANVWGVDYSSSINESNKVRSSFGAALDILTPIGPLSFSLAQPITKENTDVTESFRFQLGTTF